MFVAKSYQSLSRVGEPYKKNSRMYTLVQMNNGATKEVRLYTESEYKRLYPDMAFEVRGTQKKALGFEKDFIYIFKGDVEKQENWFISSPCRYCVPWQWYLPSSLELPLSLPEGIEPVKLFWDEVGNEQGELLSDLETIKKHVKKVLN